MFDSGGSAVNYLDILAFLCSREKTYQHFYDHLYNEALGY